ncbi:UNVERIFIED_CONTAM: hypothetical protein PYX00_008372 [Menopon gallinae]|uniref:Vacuolar ATPase assembly integral membrane protein VMA21 homolog n=1 Tax=Menopon gallinae TaxID=328185 RepID=A0AAW2HN19_9NEOP
MPSDLDTFRVVLYYSVAILALPISTFFTTKVILFDRIFGTDNVTGNVYAAVCAVLMLHGALGLFIFKAYSEDGDKKKKLDKAD